MQTQEERRRICKARSRLLNYGCCLRAGPRWHWAVRTFGPGWQIESGGKVIAGATKRFYEMSLDEIEAFIVAQGMEQPRERERAPPRVRTGISRKARRHIIALANSDSKK